MRFIYCRNYRTHASQFSHFSFQASRDSFWKSIFGLHRLFLYVFVKSHIYVYWENQANKFLILVDSFWVFNFTTLKNVTLSSTIRARITQHNEDDMTLIKRDRKNFLEPSLVPNLNIHRSSFKISWHNGWKKIRYQNFDSAARITHAIAAATNSCDQVQHTKVQQPCL